MDINNIKSGTLVSYGFFKNIKFVGTEDDCVILEDKNGNRKKVFKSLFQKYGKII